MYWTETHGRIELQITKTQALSCSHSGQCDDDVKILRNAGARVTDDVLRTLVLATFLLGVNRVLVVPHTDCRMASATEAEIHQTISDEHGIDTRSVEFRTVRDQKAALATDV